MTEGILAKFLTMGLNDWCSSFIFSIFFIQFCSILNLYPNMHHVYKSNNATLIMSCIVHGSAQSKCIRAQSRRQISALIQCSGEVIQNEGAKKRVAKYSSDKDKTGGNGRMGTRRNTVLKCQDIHNQALLSPTACFSSPVSNGRHLDSKSDVLKKKLLRTPIITQASSLT